MSKLLDWVEKWWGITETDIRLEQVRRSSEMLELLIESQEIENKSKVPWEYKSLADMAKEDVVSGSVDGPKNQNDDVLALCHAVADAYGMHLRAFRYYVPEGLRLYVQDKNGFREGADSDPNWHYFRLTAEQDENISVSIYESPNWAKTLYLKHENYRIWRAIYWDVPSTNDPEYIFVKRTKRTAVDALMDDGVDVITTPPKRNDSMPRDLCAAIEAFEAVYGNPSATAKQSPKAAIAAWLESNKPELSANARERIAIVANWQPSGGAPKTPGE